MADSDLERSHSLPLPAGKKQGIAYVGRQFSLWLGPWDLGSAEN